MEKWENSLPNNVLWGFPFPGAGQWKAGGGQEGRNSSPMPNKTCQRNPSLLELGAWRRNFPSRTGFLGKGVLSSRPPPPPHFTQCQMKTILISKHCSVQKRYFPCIPWSAGLFLHVKGIIPPSPIQYA